MVFSLMVTLCVIYCVRPSFAQEAALVALDYEMGGYISRYREKRNVVSDALTEWYRVEKPRGSFFVFPKAEDGDGGTLVERVISKGFFIIPGRVFSQRPSHFRSSCAAPMDLLERGVKRSCTGCNPPLSSSILVKEGPDDQEYREESEDYGAYPYGPSEEIS